MISITPYLDGLKLGDYQDKLVHLYQIDSHLNQSVPASIRESVEWLLRQVNCYYSNRIEGNPTHPKELLKIQSPQTESPYNFPVTRPKALQELLAHLEVQLRLKNRQTTADEITTQEFIKELHKSFYQGLPEDQLIVKKQDGETALDEQGNPLLIVPGEYRKHLVIVGSHEPPPAKELTSYMDWLQRSFTLSTIHGTNRVIAAASLHHRLAWIHPFLDGNGRVIRLLTDCYMRHSGFGGYGLWSITRGFARDTKAYYNALAQADKVRQGMTDGRGTLSDGGLAHFTKYFIDTALDQISYFSELLEPRKLNSRIDIYFEMRAKGALPAAPEEELPLLQLAARDIYKYLLDRGPQTKSNICAYLGKSEQSLRATFKQMESERLINLKKDKHYKAFLSPHVIEYLFPNLW
ncbi:Fic family protein [Pseudomonas sp. T1.Ur]|uniref:Fic family protein n=1 Tax=Pseudomonas sp. T1.Ur TaxID=2928704 RepID=UPI00201D35AB|nr:Fic family protein [Pseudomonas sp. T1.Ur]MCL6704679.1 Fic family protein [Pseudomonas sp. T1.Ur]